MDLLLLPHTLAVCRLAARSPVPVWATGDFVSITSTADELSIVCPQDRVPKDAQAVRGWRCLQVAGTLDFTQVGVLAALAEPLAEAEISIFVISTFDTDYLMVRQADLERARVVLGEAGHAVTVL